MRAASSSCSFGGMAGAGFECHFMFGYAVTTRCSTRVSTVAFIPIAAGITNLDHKKRRQQ
jgi:hypothetical protein